MALMNYRLDYRLPLGEEEYPLWLDLFACRRLVFGVFDDADCLVHVVPVDSDGIRSLPQRLPEETFRKVDRRLPSPVFSPSTQHVSPTLLPANSEMSE